MASYAGLLLESDQNKIRVGQVGDVIVPRLVAEPLSLLVLSEGLEDSLARIEWRCYERIYSIDFESILRNKSSIHIFSKLNGYQHCPGEVALV